MSNPGLHLSVTSSRGEDYYSYYNPYHDEDAFEDFKKSKMMQKALSSKSKSSLTKEMIAWQEANTPQS